MNFLFTLFCRHKWKSHTKKEYIWREDAGGYSGTYSETVEIFICDKCGKIKKISY